MPVLDDHKRGVVDPVSALLMPVQAGRGAARSPPATAPSRFSTGSGRFDVTLSFCGDAESDLPGYSGAVLVCAARYNPIAGHRTGRKSTQFMADNKDMEVWLAPVEGPRVLCRCAFPSAR